MKTHCTRPGCPRPTNVFADLDDRQVLKKIQQKFCTACGMPQILGGRYIPLKLLGQGGFGAAFLAVDRYTPKMRQCVVKQFQPSNDLQPEQLKIAQELFDREAEALEDLGNRHPQIPNLFAFFELQVPGSIPQKSEDYFYLVQEFIDGLNMEEALAQRGPFPEDEVLEILVEVLKILKFVHDHNAIHRDIKPSNVMRLRQGRIYLLDFGAVKQSTVGQSAKAGQQRSTGIYSMGFAPPEQMQGDKVYPATDLSALGVTCITLLTGKDPTELYDSYSNTWNWRAYAPVSDRLEAIFNRMLQATPRERFQSADEILNLLGALPKSSRPKRPPAPPTPPSVPSSKPSSSPSTTLQRSAGVAQANPTLPPPASVAPPPPPVAPPPPPVASSPVPASQAMPTPSPKAKKAVLPKQPSPKRSLSSFAVIKGALFTGFETGLLAIAA
ncbi:MAG: serine/threonine protein kinase, partial [Moorea sp. SIO3C2]|nr:serine/threonine protein kinase [Moorena sp. SIO3C2]